MLMLNLFTVAMLLLFVASVFFSIFWLRPKKQELALEYGEDSLSPVSVATVMSSEVRAISLTSSGGTVYSSPLPEIKPEIPSEVQRYTWLSRITLAVMVVSGALFIFCLPLINA